MTYHFFVIVQLQLCLHGVSSLVSVVSLVVRAVVSLLEGRLSSTTVVADIDCNFKVFNVVFSSTGWPSLVGCWPLLVMKNPDNHKVV